MVLAGLTGLPSPALAHDLGTTRAPQVLRHPVRPPGAPTVVDQVEGDLGLFTPQPSRRLVDTRTGATAIDADISGRGPLASGDRLVVPVAPAMDAAEWGSAAVVVDITVLDPTAAVSVFAYPDGEAAPSIPTLVAPAHLPTSETATVPLGGDGSIELTITGGTTDLLLDVQGAYSSRSGGGDDAYQPTSARRLLDTRSTAPVRAGQDVEVCSDDTYAKVAAAEVTATAATGSGYLVAWELRTAPYPDTSLLEVTPRRTVTNLVVVGTEEDTVPFKLSCFMLGYRGTGSVQLLVDLVGTYNNEVFGGSAYRPVWPPIRIADSATGAGLTPLAGGHPQAVATGIGNLATTTLVGTVTGSGGNRATGISVGVGSGTSLTLAAHSAQSASYQALVTSSAAAGHELPISSLYGTTQVDVDVTGWFVQAPNFVDPGHAVDATTLTASAAGIVAGTPVTFTAHVSGGVVPTGRVAFVEANGTQLGDVGLDGSTAVLTVSGLAPGIRSFRAEYLGDALNGTSLSTRTVISVGPAAQPSASSAQQDAQHDGYDPESLGTANLSRRWTAPALNYGEQQQAGQPARSIPDIPVTAEGRAFFETNDGLNDPVTVEAYDLATGKRDWGVVVPGSPSSPTAELGVAYDGGRVFVLSPRDVLFAYDADTGSLDWATQLGQYFGGGAPVAYDGVVYASGAGDGGDLYAVSESTGQLSWGHFMEGAAPITVDDSGVYAYDGVLDYGFDVDGVLRWYHVSGAPGLPFQAPIHDQLVYLQGSSASNPIESAADGAEIDTYTADAQPAFVGPVRYQVDGGALAAIETDPVSGRQQTLWTAVGDGHLTGAPVATDDAIFVASSTGAVYGFDSADGRQDWTATPDATDAYPQIVVSEGTVLVSEAGNITAYAAG